MAQKKPPGRGAGVLGPAALLVLAALLGACSSSQGDLKGTATRIALALAENDLERAERH